MEKPEDIIAKVLGCFPLAKDMLRPDRKLWLTLYLNGNPDTYAEVKPQLHALGWVNLCDEHDFAGFVYPKKEVFNAPASIRDALLNAITVCQKLGMQIGSIDADTEVEPKTSNFQNLYQST
jgi:hypothetical protein